MNCLFKTDILKIKVRSSSARQLFYIGIFTSFLFAQSKYPADPVLTSPNTTILEKTVVLPIAGWQRISHHIDLLNCQFYPSCSQYGAIAVKENGVLKGLPMVADRIIRCNPSAHFNHIRMNGEFYGDYRLVDNPQSLRHKSVSKSPIFAGTISALVPGAGRIYAGRWFDGIMGFFMVYLTTSSAVDASKGNHIIDKMFFYTIAGIFYAGEIYGAYRSAKFYQLQ